MNSNIKNNEEINDENKIKSVLKFIGIKDLEENELEIVTLISSQNLKKIIRATNNLSELIVHVKATHKSKNKDEHHRFSVHLRVISEDGFFNIKKTDEYDLTKAIHMSFDDLETHLKNKIRK